MANKFKVGDFVRVKSLEGIPQRFIDNGLSVKRVLIINAVCRNDEEGAEYQVGIKGNDPERPRYTLYPREIIRVTDRADPSGPLPKFLDKRTKERIY